MRRAEPGFAVAGVVEEVLVRPGDLVRTGQVMARLDPTPLMAQRAAALADEAKAQALLAEARRRLARVEAAHGAGATSPAEATGAQADLASAEAALRAAQAQRELASWSLDRATLRATLDGSVGARHIEPGQQVPAGSPAFAIDGPGRELVVVAPGALRLAPGQPVRLSLGGKEVPSRVLKAHARLDAGGTRRIYVSVPEDATVGATLSVLLPDPGKPGSLRVPLRAVARNVANGTGTVLRISADGATVERVTVTLGALQADTIEVLSGLARNDRVVVAGASGIGPGVRVKPVSPATGAAS